MQQPSLSPKATVTRRQPAFEPVDADERARQSEHHQAAESAAQTANQGATAMQSTEAVLPQHRGDPHALQSAFLAGNLGKLVTVFTINGVRLTGKLRQFDQFTLLLEGQNGISSLVFKHAATTIVPVSTANGEPRHPQQGDAYP